MIFNTTEFFLLFIITLGFYYLLPGRRLYILAVANALFYIVGGIGYLGLFVFISTITYLFSQILQGSNRKLFLGLAVSLNVVNLLFFKYSLFILSNIGRLFPVALVNNHPFFANLVLPIGISFYTFELIAYLVDVYREKIPPAKSLLVFWVFISFFPHRVAGPIMRGRDLIPDLENAGKITWSASQWKLGIAYLAMGLVKKILIADYLADYAAPFFTSVPTINGVEAWIGAYLYTFQIYFDFSAYSEMAIGIAFLLGIKLDLNFRTPYLSENPSEFWKRWHITLSTWIRDYLYIPLGGSRLGEWRKHMNLFVSMAISGLWHGAAWVFAVWGMYHGLLLILHKLYGKVRARLRLPSRFEMLYKALSILITFHLICMGWVFFRASSINQALMMIKKMLTVRPYQLSMLSVKYLAVVAGLYLLHIIEHYARTHYEELSSWWGKRFPPPIRALVYTALIVILVLFVHKGHSSFIYFKF
ncbi:MAG TPA: MBOAT family O-acyltransferase [Syntrophomonadaceae bacterium]|nr:MBOAT family O-acyltransferase [Syntrophomonadaceae bacterium]